MCRRNRVLGVCAVALLAFSGGRPAEAGGSAAIGAVSTIEVQTPGERGSLEHFGSGVGASILYLCSCDDLPTGFEASTSFVIGDAGQRLYDLGVSIMGSFPVKNELAVPFISLGLDLSAATIPDPDDPEHKARGVTAGVHGNIGLHGFLGKDLYWRGQVGYLGAGVGGLTGQLSLGYVFDD